MQFTREQQDAIRINEANLIVEAGAGTGKTRVLIERYLQLLDDNPDWRISSLVAITFTREAAYEMRHRLRQELEARARHEDGERWARRLAQLDRARIDTIHGLCADLLRANAAQAGVDPKFEVMDENEAAILLDDTVDDVLAAVEAPVSRLFAHYDAFMIENALKQPSLINAGYEPPPADAEALFQRWESHWSEDVVHERRKLLSCAELAALAPAGPASDEDKLAALIAQYRGYLDRIESSDDARDIVQLMEECYGRGAVGNKGSAKAWGGNDAKREAAQSLRSLRARIKDALDSVGAPPGELDRATAEVLPLWHQLLQRVKMTYRERKEERAQLDFDDLERLTAQLLQDPVVRNRYRGAEFKHLLVDEFQDTNAAQWQIISSLADLRQGGLLFLVGDPKQSIYQFRGADVSVFNRVRAELDQLESGRVLPLSRSFRAHRPLIDQFNALFGQILQQDADSPVADFEVPLGKAMTAARAKPPALPAIEIQLLVPPEQDESAERDTERPRRREDSTADDMRRWEADEIAQHIKRMVADGRPVFDRESSSTRAMEYRDVAVLFQSTTKLTLYEDAFKTHEIPYLTVAGRGYYDRQEVWDMLDLLRFLHNPADNLALATVLRSPIFAFSDDLLYALCLDAAEDAPLQLWPALTTATDKSMPAVGGADLPLIRHAVETLMDLRRAAGRVTISELLRLALAKTNYLAILTGLPDGARRRGNVEKLLELAEESGKITLGKFSRYLVELSAREAREGEAALEPGNAVRLMTAHASKGLEFPLVILADAAWARGVQGAPTLIADPGAGLSCRVFREETHQYESGYAHRSNLKLRTLKEEAERKRLLYVAATRARDYLFISGRVNQRGGGDWTARGWLKLLLPALGLDDPPTESCTLHAFAGGQIRVLMPPAPAARFGQPAVSANKRLWDLDFNGGRFPPLAPPLMKTLPPYTAALPRHISATQLEDFGAFQRGRDSERAKDLRRQFRNSVLNKMPEVDGLMLAPDRPTPRLFGQIAHEVLRYADFSAEFAPSEDMIRAIAWEKGITNPATTRQVSRELHGMLQDYRASVVCKWINAARAAARPLYTELPFIYRRNERVIHGVIDVLLQQEDGAWVIIDYKTSAVHDGDYARHARRFRLQLGIYAAALQEQFALARFPLTVIHYLRGNETVTLLSGDCLQALDQLELTIDELMAPDDQT
ncbi:MAG: UvrD-helicase domain-containing protein [Chloroflexota bacterium]|nr:UvrD-helicase domain-containing protein [Chloroflexota bacterium]MDE2948563.1 UvrD-helicase domain-containing protein [Chloroflexota bacterium]